MFSRWFRRFSAPRRLRPLQAQRRLSLQSLEPRQLLAVFAVDNLLDESDGDFSQGNFTLREAIEQTNATQGTNTIEFKPGLVDSTIELATPLVITRTVEIEGLGAQRLTVRPQVGQNIRLFEIRDAVDVTIIGLELTGGRSLFKDDGSLGDGQGGAILATNVGNLKLAAVWLNNNFAALEGGAVAVLDSRLGVFHTTISNNVSRTAGAGIYFDGPEDALAGTDPSLRVQNSTITRNLAQRSGTPVSGGVGIYVADKHARIVNSTIVLNRTGTSGGGVFTAVKPFTSTTLYNTLVAGNVSAGGVASDLGGKNVSPGSANNLIGDANTAGGLRDGRKGNIVGNQGTGTRPVGTVIDPRQTPVGIRPPVHLLRGNSVAIDQGRNGWSLNPDGEPLENDQRGFPRYTDYDNAGGVVTDIGAVEMQPPVVTTGASRNYHEGDVATALLPAATLRDEESANFLNGRLTVRLGNSESDDILSVRNQGTGPGQIGVDGTAITFGGTLIGRLTVGRGNAPLVVQFNANATPIRVQALLRNITFQTRDPLRTFRSLAIQVTDGDGGVSAIATTDFQVVPR